MTQRMETPTPKNQLAQTSQQTNTNEPANWKQKLTFACKLTFVVLFVCVILNAFIRVVVFTPIHGNSMQPTYQPKQMVVTYRYKPVDSYEYGDIVVVKVYDGNSSGAYIIKRVIGLPSDILSYDSESKRLVRNGQPLDESYIAVEAKINGFGWFLGEYTVPDGCLFVLGDNRNHSFDSRHYGAFPYDDIYGYVIPDSNFKLLDLGENIG